MDGAGKMTLLTRAKAIIFCLLALLVTVMIANYALNSFSIENLSYKHVRKCDCWYPNTGKYGVKDKKGRCLVVECERPKAAKK